MDRPIVDGPLKEFVPQGGKGPIQRLREGGFDLERLKLVMLSHQHFDRGSHFLLSFLPCVLL